MVRWRRRGHASGPQPIDPAKLRFLTPTTCDVIPGDSLTLRSSRAFELDEDDWRDVELVADSQQAHVEVNFAEIREIYGEEADTAAGFSRVHVRHEPASPLGSTRIEMADVVGVLAKGVQLAAVHLRNHSATAAGTYAMVLASGRALYGSGAPERLQHNRA